MTAMPIVSIALGIQDLGTQPVGESCEMPKAVGVSRRHFKKTEECTGGNYFSLNCSLNIYIFMSGQWERLSDS